MLGANDSSSCRTDRKKKGGGGGAIYNRSMNDWPFTCVLRAVRMAERNFNMRSAAETMQSAKTNKMSKWLLTALWSTVDFLHKKWTSQLYVLGHWAKFLCTYLQSTSGLSQRSYVRFALPPPWKCTHNAVELSAYHRVGCKQRALIISCRCVESVFVVRQAQCQAMSQ